MNKNKTLPVSSATAAKSAHPAVFFFLVLPFGILNGYLTVTLAYLYSRAGISVSQIAALVAASLFPTIFKFLWAPLIDVTLSVKKWYFLATVVIASGILGINFIPVNSSSLPLLNILFMLFCFAGTFETMAVNSLMAHDTSMGTKGRAGGYFQAGATGGIGIGGGAGLWLAERLASAWMVGTILSVACLLCCIGLFYVKEPLITIRVKKGTQTIVNLFKDIWLVLKAKAGVLALFLCFLPFGTGAAGGLFAAVAKDWSASADTVALITGILGGIITCAGCLAGGFICDKTNRQFAYVLFGILQGVFALGMAWCPHTQLMYITWTSLYSFSNGLVYAGFTAFVLEVIGKGAAASKYNVYAGLSTVPQYFMTFVDGWAHTRWGVSGMLNTEAVFAVLGIALFFVFKILTAKRKPVAIVIPIRN